MAQPRIAILTLLAMLAFAGNSLLCRLALQSTRIDAASFTTIRLASGALLLSLLSRSWRGGRVAGDSWLSALALFSYAAGFSYAYRSLSAATGALLLFGAVQATMIGRGVWMGERLASIQILGLVLALGGLLILMLPGLAAPSLSGCVLMLGAGVAWGIYSLRGRGSENPNAVTAGNFLRAAPMAAVLTLVTWNSASLDTAGIIYAVGSGTLASAAGYAIWYAVLPSYSASSAAAVQLSVPILATLGGILLLGESLSYRLAIASVAVLGGIALVVRANASDPLRPRR
jgi:drug/metabolite transporter (DMT)-like permease